MDFIEEFKKKCVDAGMAVASDEEFEEWWKSRQEYRARPEVVAQDIVDEAVLDYYLDKKAKYRFTDEMSEISGFGDGYEKTCRVMLDSGLQWFDKNKKAAPKVSTLRNVYGITSADNDDAKALERAILKHVDGPTGAMVQAVTGSCLWIRKNGWDAYVKRMSELDPDEAEEAQ